MVLGKGRYHTLLPVEHILRQSLTQVSSTIGVVMKAIVGWGLEVEVVLVQLVL
jgi:hypothetical protein